MNDETLTIPHDSQLQEGDLGAVVDAGAFSAIEIGPHPGDPTAWLTADEVATRYGVTVETIANRVKAGAFPLPLVVGNRRQWAPVDLRLYDDWCRRLGADPDAPKPNYCV